MTIVKKQLEPIAEDWMADLVTVLGGAASADLVQQLQERLEARLNIFKEIDTPFKLRRCVKRALSSKYVEPRRIFLDTVTTQYVEDDGTVHTVDVAIARRHSCASAARSSSRC